MKNLNPTSNKRRSDLHSVGKPDNYLILDSDGKVLIKFRSKRAAQEYLKYNDITKSLILKENF